MKGIGVLFPGAGTLRGVFTTTDANGQRVFDERDGRRRSSRSSRR